MTFHESILKMEASEEAKDLLEGLPELYKYINENRVEFIKRVLNRNGLYNRTVIVTSLLGLNRKPIEIHHWLGYYLTSEKINKCLAPLKDMPFHLEDQGDGKNFVALFAQWRLDIGI